MFHSLQRLFEVCSYSVLHNLWLNESLAKSGQSLAKHRESVTETMATIVKETQNIMLAEHVNKKTVTKKIINYMKKCV